MKASISLFAESPIPIGILFLFQLAFAGVSLAIAWGGFAERGKLPVYFIFGILYTIIIYPIVAHWVWGGGWLGAIGMQDFAGSTVVHLQGATAALVATILLKPRIGKYNKDKTPNLIPGHNQVLSVLGVIILWIGWFGFNAGSTLSATGDGFFGHVALTTNLAAAAGAVAALIVSWIYFGKRHSQHAERRTCRARRHYSRVRFRNAPRCHHHRRDCRYCYLLHRAMV